MAPITRPNGASRPKAHAPEDAIVEFGGHQNSEDSLLAFAIDSAGKPYVEVEFKSTRDKLALLSLAEALISQLKQETLKEVMRDSGVTLAA